MKKVLLFIVTFCFAIAGNAQIKTYSSNDANQDGSVNVQDVNNVVNEICAIPTSNLVVNADSLCALLRSIDLRLAAIESKLKIDSVEIEKPDTTVTPTPTPETIDTIVDSHEYVDLGLPSGTLWATCNVGADSPEAYGDYFAWGETSPKGVYNWSTYKWCESNENTLTKYCEQSEHGTIDNKTTLDPEDDAATVNWGSHWCMPTMEQWSELANSDKVTKTWTYLNGTLVLMITSKSNGNCIVLPFAGYRYDSVYGEHGGCGDYWSRTLDYRNSNYGRQLGINNQTLTYDDHPNVHAQRYYGQSVRPVRVQK